jgi:uncharacterized YigZ family protein
MLFEDTYKTILKNCEGIFKDKGSKFIAFAYPVKTEEEVKKIVANLKKEHHGANHHCYAFRLGANKQHFRANDDGEPSNTAGKPILSQIQSNDLTNILIVVVRYFGGTLLGVSGLINAYKNAAADALKNSTVVEKTVNEIYKTQFEYLQMNDVMKIVKDENLEIISQNHELSCEIIFSIRKNNADKVCEKLKKIVGLRLEYSQTI